MRLTYDEYRRALMNNLFVPYFQPIYDVKSGICIGGEVLARLPSSDTDVMGPTEFLPFIQSEDEFSIITRVILKKASVLLMNYQLPEKFMLTFNVSANSLAEAWLISLCHHILDCFDYKITLVVELMEQYPLTTYDSCWLQNRRRLKEMGVIIALDDFGTGWANLYLLQRSEAEIIKLPREFVSAIGKCNVSSCIIETVVRLSDKLGGDVIAEGVETYEQIRILHGLGISHMQGFYFCHAVAIDIFIEHVNGTTRPLHFLSAPLK